MNIGLSLKDRLEEALALAKTQLATHRGLVQKLKCATTREERNQLTAEMANATEEWKRQYDRCTALHKMLTDYSNTGWERSAESRTR